jgi:hypothetical protein
VSAQIWAALIAAGASLVVAIFSAGRATRTQSNIAQAQRDIAELTSQLQEKSAERDARRDYEYEAKKRLYSQCEPVIFEAMELAENFRHRVISLARSAKTGFLTPAGIGWLENTDSYYFKSTAFFLLAPLTPLKVIRRRLTSIDLALESRMNLQYQLLKLAFHSYTWDFDLASQSPILDYRPDDADPGKPEREKILVEKPAVYRRQGLYLGILDQLADAMISDAQDSSYYKSLGVFGTELDGRRSGVGKFSADIAALFCGFHPASQPILWRVLVTQYLLLGAFLRTQDHDVNDGADWSDLVPTISAEEAESLNWHIQDHEAAAATPLAIGREYLMNRLRNLRSMSARGSGQ